MITAVTALLSLLLTGSGVLRMPTVPAPPPNAAAVQATMDALPQRGDGMYAVRLDRNRVAFLTGDSLAAGGGKWAHNTITVLTGSKAHLVQPQLPGQNPYQVIPDAADGSFWWLGSGFVVGKVLYTTTLHVRPTPEWPGFVTIGADWALFDVSNEPRLLRTAPGPVDVGPVWWLSGVAYDPGMQRVTVFGASRDATDGWTGHDVYAAQVPLASLLNPAVWAYWGGSGWTSDPAGASPVLRTSDGVSGPGSNYSVWRDAAGWHLTDRMGGSWGPPQLARWSTPVLGQPWTVQTDAGIPDPAYCATEDRVPLGNGKYLAHYSIPDPYGVVWIEV